MSNRRRRSGGIILFIAIVQGLLFLGHALVFETITYFWRKPRIPHLAEFLALASITFIPASFGVRRSKHFFAWAFYRLAAIWLGFLSLFFVSSILCWTIYTFIQLFGLFTPPPHIGQYGRGLLLGVFGTSIVAGIAALINGSWIRVTEISVALPGLPESWKTRKAVLASDLHLGPVRGFIFSRRVVALARKQQPDIVFLAGDVYDGTAVDEEKIASAWKDFPAPLGVYYVTGNHEEFSDRTHYLRAIESAGIHILRNEKRTVDGLQIAGALYGESSGKEAFRETLARIALDPSMPSILLSHVPQHFDVAEEAGVSLKLSGHTHNGQLFPWNLLARRVHGPFVYGLNRFKRMQVYTSSGAGTWGPPMRLATRSEIVVIRFQ